MSRFSGIILGLLLLISLALGVIAWLEARQAVVLVEWTTASELDTVGFNLYRSENPAGPFTKINSTLIPAAADPLTGSQYSYRDEQVLPGRQYFYQLEEVEMDGSINRFGPISGRSGDQRGVLILSLVAILLSLLLALRLVLMRRQAERSGAPRAGSEGEG